LSTARTGARTGLVGVVVPVVYDLYFSGILGGIAEGVYDEDLRLVVWPTRHEHAREASLLERMEGTDGVVIVLPEASSEELLLAASERCPLVVVDPLLPLDPRIPTVEAAHAAGADQAMQHLLELGHRRIAAITGPPGWVATEERRNAYRAALRAAGVAFDPALEIDADFEVAPGAQAAAALLELPEPPTAVFSFNDTIALGVLRTARQRSLCVPEDLSIVGFDDVTYATVTTPQLTTVRQPLAEMGRSAVRMLLRLIAGGGAETLHIQLPTRLVVRESTGPPRNSGVTVR